MSGGADLLRSVAHYRDLAPRYDHYTRRINRIRAQAIEALQLQPGDTVLDAGCGTGWGIPRLLDKAGSTGKVFAFDPSHDMLRIARTRLTAENAVNVELFEASAEAVELPAPVDAILFSYTHDLINSRPALDNVLRQARPARAWRPPAPSSTDLGFPANWYLELSHRKYITNFENFQAPWSLLATYLDDFRVRTGPFTQHYVATGRVRP